MRECGAVRYGSRTVRLTAFCCLGGVFEGPRPPPPRFEISDSEISAGADIGLVTCRRIMCRRVGVQAVVEVSRRDTKVADRRQHA